MKSKKIFGKKHIIMAALVVALGAAVWLNMEYSSLSGGFVQTGTGSSADKNLGDTKYVMTESVSEVSDSETDYFEESRTSRKKARNESLAILEETVKSASADENAVAEATEKITQIAANVEKESAIETLIKSKGFEDVVVIIGENSVNVIVKSDKLLESQILQIQDAVTSQTEISLEKIKIVNRK